jgi:hypothetical protein
MKTYTFSFLFCLLASGCAAYPGTDGRTYYWPKPLPMNNGGNYSMSPSATTTQVQVNTKSYTITSFK